MGERRAERRGKFHRTRRPWRVVRTEGTKTYDDKKKSMRRARKFYGILESRRQVVGGDDYKRDIGRERRKEIKREREKKKESQRENGTNPVKPRVTCPVYYKVTYDQPKRAERTSFINSKPGRQIGKSVKVVVQRGTLLFEIKIKVRDVLLYLLFALLSRKLITYGNYEIGRAHV